MPRKQTLFSASSIRPIDRIVPYSGIAPNMQDFIPFGSDNLFPNALALFSRQSPNHRGVLNSKVNYCLGDGLFPLDEKDTATQDILDSINFEGESLNDVQMRLFLDRFMVGNYDLECITDKNRTFLWFNQIDATMCRLSKDNESILIHPDWSMYTGKKDKFLKILPKYPNFQPDTVDGISAYRCVFHKFDYEPEFTFYGIPQWIAGKDSVQIDLRTNKWNLGRLKNSFRPGSTLVVPVADATEGEVVTKAIKDHYTGEEKQGKTLILTKSRAAENEKADQTQYIPHVQEDKGSWTELHKQSTGDIIVSHGWYRALTGLTDNTGFDTERILNEYYTALATVISNEQDSFIKVYKKIYRETLGAEFPVVFHNSPPLQNDKYQYIWELRKARGLKWDENDPVQQELIK